MNEIEKIEVAYRVEYPPIAPAVVHIFTINRMYGWRTRIEKLGDKDGGSAWTYENDPAYHRWVADTLEKVKALAKKEFK